jgi:tetratricopeptide (TPR) repeat protein
MKKRLILTMMMLVALGGLALAQLTGGTVRGKCSDEQGKPYAAAIVRFLDTTTGRKYELKTNAKGEYVQVAIALGTYDVTLVVDGKNVFTLHGISPDPNKDTVVDFDLAKERAIQQQGGGSPGKVPIVSEEEKKKNAAIEQENLKIRDINQLLKDADAAKTAGNIDQAIALLTQASQLGPDKELVWIRLADTELTAQKYADAVTPHQKAIALMSAQPEEKQNKMTLAALHNNLGQAYAHVGKTQEAIQEYSTAAQVNPKGAAQYYFNLGAVLTNTNHPDEGNAAFDKAIAVDPTYADAYYQKGVNLLSKGVTDVKTGKTAYPPEAGVSLNKYLELQPTGKHAAEAKQLIEYMGMTVQTTYRSTPTAKKPPK